MRINKVIRGSLLLLEHTRPQSPFRVPPTSLLLLSFCTMSYNPPCRAEVINPSRVVQRSMESILVPQFSGHLIGITPVCVLCQLVLAKLFVDHPIGTAEIVATVVAN